MVDPARLESLLARIKDEEWRSSHPSADLHSSPIAGLSQLRSTD